MNSLCVTGQGDLDPVLVAAENSKVTLNVDSHVANAHIVTGLPQRKGLNPNACQLYTKIKYVKDVFCVGHLCSVNLVTKAQHAVLDPPVGARLNQCWEKWEALGSSPKVVATLREGYTLPFRFRPHLTRSPTVISNYHNSAKQSFLLEALCQLINKNAVEPVENQNSLGFYNRLFLVPKPNNRWRPVLDLSTLNTFLNTGSFKMETPETIRTSLQAGEWVTSIDFKDAYFHIPIHSQSRKYMRFHLQGRSYQFKALPFDLSTAPMEFTVVAKEVKLMALQKGIRTHQYLDDWLVRASTHDTCLQHTQILVTLCQDLGWLVNREKSTGSEGPRVTGKGDPGPQIPPPPPKVMAGGKQCASRSTITPSKTCSANLDRRIKRRVGRLLRRAHYKGTVVPTREQIAHKPLGAESSISSSKRVSNPRLQQDSVDSYRQHTLPVCPTVENTVLVYQAASNPLGTSHPRLAERDSRQAIQTWPDHSTEWSLHPEVFQGICSRWRQPQVDLFATRFNNKLPQFVSPVPDPQAWAVDALGLSWEDLDPYAFPPAAILGKVVEKLQNYPCNRIILIAPGWPNMPWFWDLVAMSSQIPLCLPSIPNLVSQPFNQVLHRNLSNLNLHAWLLEPQQSRSKASLRQWQHKLRLLKEDQPDLSMRQSGPFLQSGASVIRWTSGHHL